jgi:pantothenate kinase type III
VSLALVTLDLGNSGLKLRSWSEREGSQARFALQLGIDVPIERLREPGAAQRAELREELARLAGQRAGLSSVASAEVTRDLVELAQSAGLQLEPELDCGLANLTHTPQSVGKDRLFAARGAVELVGSSCLVLDAGTALTIDAVVVPHGAVAQPQFLGGAIAPGPRLAARALHTLTARLPDVEPRPGVPALGRDTHEALRAGVVHGFRGAATELALRVAAEAGLERAPAVLTGGAARFLLEPRPILAPLLHEPELVHLGLLAALAGPLWLQRIP